MASSPATAMFTVALTAFTGLCLGIVCIAFCFATPLRRFLPLHGRNDNSNVAPHHIYSDLDGEAAWDGEGSTSASQNPQSSTGGKRNSHRTVRFLIPTLALAALGFSGLNWALNGLGVVHGLMVGGWILINIDAVFLIRAHRSPRNAFNIGLLIALSALSLSLALAVSLGIQAFTELNNPTTTIDTRAFLQLRRISIGGQLVAGILLALAACSIPRRPTVYFQGRPVDGQFTCSVLERYSYAWVRPLLDQARSGRGIEFADLPALDHATRARELRRRFPTSEGDRRSVSGNTSKRPLWRVIVADHYGTFVRQWSVAVTESMVAMLPAVCLFKILGILETRGARDMSSESPDNSSAMLWFWIVCLAGSKVTDMALENWLYWISFGLFATPVRSQLSGLIFEKAMRLKATEGAMSKPKKEPEGDTMTKRDAQETDPLLPREIEEEHITTDDEKKKEEDAPKGMVNLLSVDAQRVSDFCGWNMDLIRGVAKITISAIFLTTLIGWWSTLAGLAVPVLLYPLNRMATQNYTKSQLLIMAARDNKSHVVGEALHGIRQIKFSATENQWEGRILVARERELTAQWRVNIWNIVLKFAWMAMPALIGAAALSVYAWTSGQMMASVAFTALSVFSSLEWTIGALPVTITELIDARVSVARIQEHLEAEEQPEAVKNGDRVEFRGASVTWPSNGVPSSSSPQAFNLRDINLKFPRNELSVIHGKTGTGKSLLLAAIIGEADITAGEILAPRTPPMHQLWNDNNDTLTPENWIVPGAKAFVSQVPWIENTSVKEAILFGLPYQTARYNQILDACALREDLAILPDGDATEVGATGINLSGGQRWRLTFARALYSRAEILVLDDIFSAVDGPVGRHLLEHGLLGPLGKNRTKILATHHVGLVKRYASYVVTVNVDTTVTGIENESTSFDTHILDLPNGDGTTMNMLDIDADPDANVPTDRMKPTPKKFVEDEKREQGRVKWSVYKSYMTSSGGWGHWILTIFLFALSALSTIARSYWIALWTKAYAAVDGPASAEPGMKSSPEDATQQNHQILFYMSIYLIISLTSVSLIGVKITVVLLASLRAARHLFQRAVHKVLRAPLRWLDTEPTGRILKRFVGDFTKVDGSLGGDIVGCIDGVFAIGTILSAAFVVSFWMLIPVTCLVLAALCIVAMYIDAVRDTKRLESTSESPIFDLVGSAARDGLMTIRTFARVDAYLTRMDAIIDIHSQAWWHVLLATQWMRFRQGLLGVLFTLCIAVGVTLVSSSNSTTIDAALAGFALSFALNFSTVTEQTISRYARTELDMNATERVLEYAYLGTEEDPGKELSTQPPASWPSHGALEVQNLSVGYAPDLPPVLHDITFSVRAGERVAVVGRTGSGKSSLTLALFRFLAARTGTITIDGLDTSKLSLYDLRSRLGIIPQDPVLFSGSLRENLDPFSEYPDEALMDVLRQVGGDQSNAAKHSLFSSLATPITRHGTNLSQGEKQLVCLARALILRPRLLILDEATSAIDSATDEVLQTVLRGSGPAKVGESGNGVPAPQQTLLVIAHRLHTIADFDRVLVMQNGHVVEFGPPGELIDSKGAFWTIVMESGGEAEEILRRIKLGTENKG